MRRRGLAVDELIEALGRGDGGELLAASVAQAQARVDAVVDGWLIELKRAEQAATVEAGQDALAPA